MAKLNPPQSPDYCLAITQASYAKTMQEGNTLLKSRYPNAAIVAEQSFKQWKVSLVQQEDQLSAVFRGTDHASNWIGNFLHEAIGAWAGTRSRFEHWIKEQEQLLGREVTLITGHSAGAVYGSAVFKTSSIARVFFNGHRVADHPEAIYLSTANDPLTFWHFLKSNDLLDAARNVFILGPGNHALNDFSSYLNKDITWDLLKTGNPDLQQFMLKSTPHALFNKPLSLEKLNDTVEDVTGKGEFLYKVIDTNKFLNNCWNAAREIASQMQMISSMRNAEREQLRQGENQLHELKQHNKDLQETAPILHMDLAINIHNRLHPAHFATLVQETQMLAAEYREALDILRKTLDQSHELDFALLEQQNKLGELSDKQQAAYKQLLDTHQKMNRVYRKIETILAIVGGLCTATGHAYVAGGLLATNGIVHYLHSRTLDQQAIIQNKSLKNINSTARVQDKVVQAQSNNLSRYNNSLQSYRQLVHDICHNPYALPVKETRKHLEEAIVDFTREYETATKHAQALIKQEQKLQKQIDGKTAEALRVRQLERCPGHKKKEKNKLNRKIDQINGEILQLKASLQTLKQPIQDAEKAKESLFSDLTEVKDAKTDWESHIPFQMRCEDLISSEARYICANSGESLKIQQVINTNLDKYESLRTARLQAFMQISQQLTQLSQLAGWSGDTIQGLTFTWIAGEESHKFYSVIIPAWQEKMSAYQGSLFSSVVNHPAATIAAIASGMQLVIGIAQAFAHFRRAYLGADPSVKSIYQQMTEILQQNMRDIADCLEQRLSTKLDGIEDRLIQNLKTECGIIKKMVALSTNQVLTEIQKARKEGEKQRGQSHADLWILEIEDRANEIATIVSKNSKSLIAFVKKLNQNTAIKKDLSIALNDYFTSTLKQLENTLASSNNSLVSSDWEQLPAITHSRANVDLLAGALMESLGSKYQENWKILFSITEHFLADMYFLLGNRQLADIVRQDKDINNALSNVLARISQAYDTIDLLAPELEGTILRLYERQCHISKIGTKNIAATEKEKTTFLQAVYQKHLKSFKWDQLKSNLVGSKKFAIYREITEGNPELSKELNTLIKTYHAEDTQRWRTFFIRCLMFSTLKDGWVYGHMQRIRRNNPSAWPNNNSIGTSSSGDLQSPTQEYALAFDLKNRKTTWIKPTDFPQYHEKVAHLKIHDYFAKIHITYDYSRLEKYFIQPINISSYKNYDESLNHLVKNYESYLNDLLEERSPDPANPLTNHLAKGTVIFHHKEEHTQIPLIFPESVMRAMEQHVAPIERELQITNTGFLIPYYNFSDTTSKLEILYKLVSKKLSNISGDAVLSFDIASFSPEVIQAFQPDWTKPLESTPNEFLLQVLYGHLIHKDLGLPGRWSFDDSGQKPKATFEEVPSGGLYPVWAHMFENVEKLPTEQRKNIDIALNLIPRPGADFLSIASQARIEKDKILTDEEYKRLFFLLRPLIHIYSNLPENQISDALEEHFNLIHPDRIAELYDQPQFSSIDQKKMKLFFGQILSQPGRSLLTYLHHQKQLDTLEAWMSGSIDQLPTIKDLQLPALPKTPVPGSSRQPQTFFSSELSTATGQPLPLYLTSPTIGDGACALHAFFGNLSAGNIYYTPDAREQYIRQFAQNYSLHKDIIQEELTKLLQDYLEDCNRGSRDPHTTKLFASMQTEIADLRQCIAATQDKEIQESTKRQFFDNPMIRQKYLDCCQDTTYHFSDCELAIAAHLFGKRVHILIPKVPGTNSSGIISSGPADGEVVYISHKNDHYSRLELNKEKNS